METDDIFFCSHLPAKRPLLCTSLSRSDNVIPTLVFPPQTVHINNYSQKSHFHSTVVADFPDFMSVSLVTPHSVCPCQRVMQIIANQIHEPLTMTVIMVTRRSSKALQPCREAPRESRNVETWTQCALQEPLAGRSCCASCQASFGEGIRSTQGFSNLIKDT